MQDGAGATVQSEDHTALPSTRAEALALGAKKFFPGTPCRNGHVAPRSVRSWECDICRYERNLEWANNNPDKIRALRIKHRETVRLAQRRRYETDRELLLARARSWKAKNKDKVKEYALKWNAANPGRKKAAFDNWHKANPGKQSEFNQRRRALKRSAEGVFTVQDIERIRLAQKGRCAACGKTRKKLSVDHIVPLSKGGTNWPSNIQLLCKSCNSSKKDKDPLTFMQSRGYLL